MDGLYKALQAIQSEVKVSKDLKNTFGNYNYRNVESIYAEVKPLLAKYDCSLIVSDEIVLVGDRYYVKATAKITNGKESIEASAYAREALDRKGNDQAQVTGGASSYARKYALGGLLLLDDNKDIDSLDHNTSNTFYSKPQAKPQAQAKPQSALNMLKAKLMSELEAVGISKGEMKKFIEQTGINANTIEGLNEALSVDLSNLASQFREEKTL